MNAPGLGFLDIAAGISSIIATSASAGVAIYGTIEGMKLAEEQQELQAELAVKRFALEEQLAQAQIRIFEIQAAGVEGRQSIELEIAAMQRDALAAQLDQIRRQQEMQTRLVEERARIELAQLEWRMSQEAAARDRIAADPRVAEEFDARISEEISSIEERQADLTESVLSGSVPEVPEPRPAEREAATVASSSSSSAPALLFAAGAAFALYRLTRNRKGTAR